MLPSWLFARLNARVAVCPVGTVCEKANVSVIQWAINFCKELVLCGLFAYEGVGVVGGVGRVVAGRGRGLSMMEIPTPSI